MCDALAASGMRMFRFSFAGIRTGGILAEIPSGRSGARPRASGSQLRGVRSGCRPVRQRTRGAYVQVRRFWLNIGTFPARRHLPPCAFSGFAQIEVPHVPCHEYLRPPARGLHARRGRVAVRRDRQALSRCPLRHRGQYARVQAPPPGEGDCRPGRARAAHLQPVSHSAPGAALRPHRPGCGHGRGVLLQLRLRGHRGGDQARTHVSATRRASSCRTSSSWRAPSTAAPWPRCRPPATARPRPASSRWCRASSACPTRTSRPSARSPSTTTASPR